WMVLILPYIEQGNVYNAYRMDRPSEDAANQAVVQTIIKTYLCPSDEIKPKPCQPNTQGWFMQRSNYGGNGGAGRDSQHSYGNSNQPNGNFMNVLARRGVMDARFLFGATLSNIKDGTSNTVALSEHIQGI